MPQTTYWSTIAGSCFHERVDAKVTTGRFPAESIKDHVQRLVDDHLKNSPFDESDGIRVSKQLPSGLRATDHPNGFDKAAVIAAVPIWLNKWHRFMADQEADGWVVWAQPDGTPGAEVEVRYELGGHPVVGSIDLVMLKRRAIRDDQIALWDYKAGRSKPDDTSQLDGYRIGFEETYGLTPHQAGYWMARTGKEHLTATLPTFTRAMLDYKFAEAGERAAQAEVGEYHIDRTACAYLCSVKDSCPLVGGYLSELVALPTPTVRDGMIHS